ncbi:hypothetical protein KP509_04G086800 [Ceratopteris richardii]|uniref:Phospholipid/glycerol acyltransferase domain-containing protein n=1 Tax=Ceratopteris richardii TaxID=49495 RepID=A0A8T2UV17_CERRI|nr:hypothetical protein KP509_04G086800 [Ceratopteris richardii]
MDAEGRCYSHGNTFQPVEYCNRKGRQEQTVVSDLDGTLLRSSNAFSYYMLVAFEASGILRFTLLLLCSPIAWFLYCFVSESAAIKLLIFLACAGSKEKEINSVARAVLPNFYIADIHPHTWRAFSSFKCRCLLTATPRLFVEPFAREYLCADLVLGTELEFTKSGRATGFVKSPGVLVGTNKEKVLHRQFGDKQPDVGLGDRPSDHPFMQRCKEGYLVWKQSNIRALDQSELPKQIVFHDGRLVRRPTPGWALIILLWLPIGLLLGLLRMSAGLLPFRYALYVIRFLGVRVVVRGEQPFIAKASNSDHGFEIDDERKRGSRKQGVLFVCNHRTLLDPIFISLALRQTVTAVTYSLSRISASISPIKTVALTRDREMDSSKIRELLEEGNLVICPEGTTCREPFILRFSALFAEISEHIVPVAINTHLQMFHATTARGWKGMDSLYFFMNPRPLYEITFLGELPNQFCCSIGRKPIEVANYVQRMIAGAVGFHCTPFTRRDKYMALAGNDGIVSSENSNEIR